MRLRWREEYLPSLAQRDLPGMGITLGPPLPLRSLMPGARAHTGIVAWSQQGTYFGVATNTIHCFIDRLAQALLTDHLSPWEGSVKKRLIKSPKLYRRESGLINVLLGLESPDSMIGISSWGRCGNPL